MNTERRHQVLIADDHPPTRAGVRYTLEQSEFEVCVECADAPSAIAAAIEHRPDICLLDIHMPGSGIEAAREITRLMPDAKVVMLTVSRDDNDLFEALRAGASGYLLKDMDPDRVPQALLGVMAGEAALPRTLLLRVMDEFRDRGRHHKRRILPGKRGEDLSAREWEVLEALHEGLDTAAVGAKLFVSPATVRSHVASILKKLRVPDRAAAIRLLDEVD